MDWLWLWHWLPVWLRPFIKGDLPSWLAVVMAVVAMIFALRPPRKYAELENVAYNFDPYDGGPIEISADLAAATHAHTLHAQATLQLGKDKIHLKLQPFETPWNYQFAAVNTFHLKFVGEYPKPKNTPTDAIIDIRANLKDGVSAKFRCRFPITS